MDGYVTDWSCTKAALNKLLMLFNCVSCNKRLKEPCSFDMCNHYYCKSCALELINNGSKCLECDIVLWREHLQFSLKLPESIAICEKIQCLLRTDEESDHTDNQSKPSSNITDEEEHTKYIEGSNTYVFCSPPQNTASLQTNCITPEVICVDDDTEVVGAKENKNSYDTDIESKNDNDDYQGAAKESRISEDESMDVEHCVNIPSVTNNDMCLPLKFHDSSEKKKSKRTSTESLNFEFVSPPKSQFSNALSDSEIENGVQRNPGRLKKKPKITYSKRFKAANKCDVTESINKENRTKVSTLPVKVCKSPNENEEFAMFNFLSGSGSNKSENKAENKTENKIDENIKANHKTKEPGIRKKRARITPPERKISKSNIHEDNKQDECKEDQVDLLPHVATHFTNHKWKAESLCKELNLGHSDDIGTYQREIPNNNNNSFLEAIDSDVEEANNQLYNLLNEDDINIADKQNIKDNPNEANKVRNVKKPKNLEKRNTKGETALHSSCIKGNYDRAKELLEFGAEPNTKDFAGWTPLHEACNHGRLNIVELLLDHGAIIDSVGGEDNDTPLHDAVSNNRLQVVTLLLTRGAPTHIRNRLGYLPLDLAITSDMKHVFKDIQILQIDTSIQDVTLQEKSSNAPKHFVATNLTPSEKKGVKRCCEYFGSKISKDYDDTITHVICGIDDKGLCKSRTLKYMFGLVNGNWIVSYQWLHDSLKKKEWLAEVDYEVKGIADSVEFAPRKSRINQYKLLPKLFDGCSFYFSGTFDESLPKEKIIELVKSGGGKILLREPKTSNVDPLITPLSPALNRLKLLPKNCVPVAIYHAKENSSQTCCTEYIIYEPAKNRGHKKVSSPVLCTAPISWLLDCISNFEILDVRDEHEKKEGLKSSQT